MADPASPEAGPHPSLGTMLPLATGLLALVGGVTYAIMRYSYQEFYNVFGLTPDDVGPGSAAALTQSGIGVVTFVTLFAVLPVALALIAAAGVDRVVPGAWRLPIRLTLAVVAALAVYRAFTAVTSGHWEAKQLIALALGVSLLGLKRSADGLGRRLPPPRWIVAALTAVIAALVLGGSLPGDARATAHCAIMRDEPVRFVHTHRTLPLLDHIGVLRVRADPAVLHWIDANATLALPEPPLVYLGDAGGRYFVFSVAAGRTVQLPDSSVVLATIPRAHCHFWQPA